MDLRGKPATILRTKASHLIMSKLVQIVRGTAALPPDLEERFIRANGREMNPEEREFFGLPLRKQQREVAEYQPEPKAA